MSINSKGFRKEQRLVQATKGFGVNPQQNGQQTIKHSDSQFKQGDRLYFLNHLSSSATTSISSISGQNVSLKPHLTRRASPEEKSSATISQRIEEESVGIKRTTRRKSCENSEIFGKNCASMKYRDKAFPQTKITMHVKLMIIEAAFRKRMNEKATIRTPYRKLMTFGQKDLLSNKLKLSSNQKSIQQQNQQLNIPSGSPTNSSCINIDPQTTNLKKLFIPETVYAPLMTAYLDSKASQQKQQINNIQPSDSSKTPSNIPETPKLSFAEKDEDEDSEKSSVPNLQLDHSFDMSETASVMTSKNVPPSIPILKEFHSQGAASRPQQILNRQFSLKNSITQKGLEFNRSSVSTMNSARGNLTGTASQAEQVIGFLDNRPVCSVYQVVAPPIAFNVVNSNNINKGSQQHQQKQNQFSTESPRSQKNAVVSTASANSPSRLGSNTPRGGATTPRITGGTGEKRLLESLQQNQEIQDIVQEYLDPGSTNEAKYSPANPKLRLKNMREVFVNATNSITLQNRVRANNSFYRSYYNLVSKIGLQDDMQYLHQIADEMLSTPSSRSRERVIAAPQKRKVFIHTMEDSKAKLVASLDKLRLNKEVQRYVGNKFDESGFDIQQNDSAAATARSFSEQKKYQQQQFLNCSSSYSSNTRSRNNSTENRDNQNKNMSSFFQDYFIKQPSKNSKEESQKCCMASSTSNYFWNLENKKAKKLQSITTSASVMVVPGKRDKSSDSVKQSSMYHSKSTQESRNFDQQLNRSNQINSSHMNNSGPYLQQSFTSAYSKEKFGLYFSPRGKAITTTRTTPNDENINSKMNFNQKLNPLPYFFSSVK